MGETIPRVKTRHPGIYKRGNRFSVRYTDRLGRQRFRSAPTLAEAQILKAILAADVARGELREVSRETFAAYARPWIKNYTGRTSNGIREATRLDYERDLESYIIPTLGRRRLNEIELRDIKELAISLQQRGLAPATIRNALAPVKALFATALEEGVLRINPTSGLRIARRKTGEMEKVKALTEDEITRLIDQIPENHRLFVRFLLHSGLRISEAIGLQWRDIDLDACKFRVERRIYRGTDDPKSRFGRRTIPLSPRMVVALAQSMPVDVPPEAPVFTSSTGTHLHVSNFAARHLKPAALRAGVPWASFHTLRHTCASRLFRAGINILQISRWMGHHSPNFTMAVYVHLLPGDAPDAGFLDALDG